MTSFFVFGLFGSLFGASKPWWKDRENGWANKGVRAFFRESQQYAEGGDIRTAIEILEWGIRFSREVGSGGAVGEMQEMIKTLRKYR